MFCFYLRIFVWFFILLNARKKVFLQFMSRFLCVDMWRMSDNVKSLINEYRRQGHSTLRISRILMSRHSVKFSRISVLAYLKRLENPKERRRVPSKISKIHFDFLQLWLEENSEQTARSLQKRFIRVFNLSLSITTIKNMRQKLKWTKTKRKYGQLISVKNRHMRVDWCLNALRNRETFENVIFVDETCVEIQSSGRMFFYQQGSRIECPTLKVPKPKHPYKVSLNWMVINPL